LIVSVARQGQVLHQLGYDIVPLRSRRKNVIRLYMHRRKIMPDRVLSSAAAREAIQRFGKIINGDLLTQINALNREGQTLSQPDNWDGRLAADFRSKWPDTNAALQKMKSALEQLKNDIQKINENIMQAGGN
jgi:uncharacterized protein YukE